MRLRIVSVPRPAAWIIGNVLIAVGVILLVGTVGLYGYSQYEEAQADREAASLGPPDVSTVVAAPVNAVAPSPTTVPTTTNSGQGQSPEAQGAQPAGAVVPVAASPTETFPPTPTPLPILPAIRIVAPTINLDAKVVESPIVNGEWIVPKFAAGHLQGTAQPLQGSNVVLSGHVQSISSGNVFAKIGNLRTGDVIRLYTNATIITYTVAKIETVPNNDLQVIQPADQEELTLITCTGNWLPLQRDYDKRTVVVAARTL
jgi:LPXTG-site transpeptidase (sortase) family protein